MIKKKWATIAGLMALCGAEPLGEAADHRDGPAVSIDGTTDIADLYTWMSGDGSKAYLVMTLAGGPMGATPATAFSNSALYVFNITSGAAFGMPGTAQKVICQFTADAAQKFSCWGPSGEYLTGSVGDVAGTSSASGKMKVFAGLRNDPFFFNIRGFKSVAATVKSVAGNLTFDAAGCPAIDAATSMGIVGLLKSDGAQGAGVDDFAKGGASAPGGSTGNVLSIVVQVDKTLITTGGPTVSVWASTNKKQ